MPEKHPLKRNLVYSNLALETEKLLKRYSIRPRRSLGQNFLVDDELIEEIVDEANVSADEEVLEIGAGLGTMTRVLAERARKVIAIEVDPALVNLLKRELNNLPNVTIIDEDILEIPLPITSKIVSNVPYSISSPLLLKILEATTWDMAILTLQKDFAARLIAEVGSKEYGRLTIAATYYSEVKLHGSYPPESFFPIPEVYSQIVELKRRTEPAFHVDRPEVFWRLSRVLFTQRNRLLAKALKTFAKGKDLPSAWSQVLLERAPERFLTRRVRELGPEDFAALADLVSSRAGTGLG
jgi:16S rRNA (adenine1518-N6/adenine1519-N6)-dimethyltransferase